MPDAPLIDPETGENQRAIRGQLERILESPGFRNSRRYPNLLRHVVERRLQGQTCDLKERTLGMDVFGRSPNYDPAADPVVRVSAGEIRKRIAQYYHESGHEAEIRIELPLGSYVPEFHLPRSKEHLDGPAPPAIEQPEPVLAPIVLPQPPRPRPMRRWQRLTWQKLALIAAVGLAGLTCAWFRSWVRPSAPLDEFWSPLLNPSVPVIFCVGRGPLPPGEPATPEQLAVRPPGIAWHDVVTLARLTGLIQSKGQAFQIRREERVTFGDLQEGPVILVGAFNDAWTLRLMEGMRFGFHQDGAVYSISDRLDPGHTPWSIDLSRKDSQGHSLVGEDYALISRFLNPRTGKIVVMVAGLSGFGTEAAGRMITDPHQMASLTGHTPAQWGKHNLQIVIGTEVIDRSPGPARVLAIHSW